MLIRNRRPWQQATEKYNNHKKFPWMTTSEVSAFLNVTTKRIYGLTAEGKLDGKKGRISTISVRKLIENQTISSDFS